MREKINGFFSLNKDIFVELLITVTAIWLYFILDRRFDFGLVYSAILLIILIIILALVILPAIKYLLNNKR